MIAAASSPGSVQVLPVVLEWVELWLLMPLAMIFIQIKGAHEQDYR